MTHAKCWFDMCLLGGDWRCGYTSGQSPPSCHLDRDRPPVITACPKRDDFNTARREPTRKRGRRICGEGKLTQSRGRPSAGELNFQPLQGAFLSAIIYYGIPSSLAYVHLHLLAYDLRDERALRRVQKCRHEISIGHPFPPRPSCASQITTMLPPGSSTNGTSGAGINLAIVCLGKF